MNPVQSFAATAEELLRFAAPTLLIPGVGEAVFVGGVIIVGGVGIYAIVTSDYIEPGMIGTPNVGGSAISMNTGYTSSVISNKYNTDFKVTIANPIADNSSGVNKQTFTNNSNSVSKANALLNNPNVPDVVKQQILSANKKEDPYARPNQKKQGREVKEKKKGDDKNWKSNPNKKKEPLPKHTPSDVHRKYKGN